MMKKAILAVIAVAAIGVSAEDANLALNKTATASSIQMKGVEAAKAVDGKLNTRWSSSFRDNQWIMIDLGSAQEVGKVVLRWENAYAKEYKVQLSMDGKEFKTVSEQKDGKGKTETITFPAEKAQFVRIQCDKRGTGYGNSLWEIQVFAK